MRPWTAFVAALLLAAPSLRADEPNEPVEERPAAEAPADDAEATMQGLLELRGDAPADPNPPVEPVDRPAQDAVPANAGVPPISVDVDRRVLGVAPGGERPTLRREGEFIISRRGRVVRSPDGAHALFVFEADSRDTPEPPMVLQPSQLLETMENIVAQRGDSVVFVVSGQVHTYRGANYLLPTMMKLAIDQGNLEN